MAELDQKARQVAEERTRTLTFSALTMDEHRDLVNAAIRTYLDASSKVEAVAAWLPEEPNAVTSLRGPLSRRATSAEFNEWSARDVVSYIDALIDGAKRAAPLHPVSEMVEAVEVDNRISTDGLKSIIAGDFGVEDQELIRGLATEALAYRKALSSVRIPSTDEREVAEGWVLVPVEPTMAMFRALTASWPQDDVSKRLTAKWAAGSFNEDYAAMIAASPHTIETQGETQP